MTDQRGNRVRRILETKRQPPEHQRLDMEPKEGGRSLLHDEFGLPKVAAAPTNKGDIPVMQELPNEPVSVRASVPDVSQVQIATGIPKKGNPSPAAQQSMGSDDGFFPPKNNFVSVGQVDNAWATQEVTGIPDDMVNNNWPDENQTDEEGDAVEQHVVSLQGMNPLADVEKPEVSQVRAQFEHRLRNILSQVVERLDKIQTLDDLEVFKGNVLGKTGVFVSVLTQFQRLPPAERPVIGELVNQIIDQLKLEFEAKEYELTEPEEEEEYPPTDEDLADVNFVHDDGEPPEGSEPEPVDIPRPTAKISSALEEGQYAILIDDKLFTVVENSADARNALSRLILGNNVPVEKIQLIKRVPIDFGVILREE